MGGGCLEEADMNCAHAGGGDVFIAKSKFAGQGIGDKSAGGNFADENPGANR